MLITGRGCKLNLNWNHLPSLAFLSVNINAALNSSKHCQGHCQRPEMLENIFIWQYQQHNLCKCIEYSVGDESPGHIFVETGARALKCFRVDTETADFLGLGATFLARSLNLCTPMVHWQTKWFDCPEYRYRWTLFGHFNKKHFGIGNRGRWGFPPQVIRTMKPPLLQ